MKALLFFLLQAYAIGTCWTKINGELVVDSMPLWPLPVVAAEPAPPPPTFLPALATPTDFQATMGKKWLWLSWKCNTGTDEFAIYSRGTNGVTLFQKIIIKNAKELRMGTFDWRTERPESTTIYSVSSIVGGQVSKPSQEIRCVP